MNNSVTTKQAVCLPSLKILGDFWTLRIIDELADDSTLRFNEIERRLEDVNTATLAKRLKEMQENQLVTRIENSRSDVTYTLTPLGREALPLLHAINHFSNANKRLRV
jgi:DNA-binding HxlR family transcriptional regulator